MKHNIPRIALLASCLWFSAKAAPFMAVGDNAELFLTANASVQLDDNIFLDSINEQDDVVYSFTPGVDFVFGKNAQASGNVYYKEEFRGYADHDDQNTSLSNVGLKSKYDNGMTKAGFNAAYAQLAQNDNDINPVGTIVHRDVVNLGANTEFGLSEKTSLSLALTYDNTDYHPAQYSDSEIWSIPLDVYYKATAKMDWSFGYRYRATDLSGVGVDTDDHFLNIGARGEFTPKLTGQVRIGYTQRSFEVGGDEDLFGINGNLIYTYSDKTSYKLDISNDFGSSGFGDSTKNFSVTFGGKTQMTEQWFMNGGLRYTKMEYPDRTDDYLEGQLAVAYTLNHYVDFSASYIYRDNSSTRTGVEFTNNVFSLGANIRY